MNRISRALTWATSRQGIHDIGALVSAAVALYESLHRVGVI